MINSRIVKNKIAAIKPATVFTISDLGIPPDWWENVRVKLGRMVNSGKLERVGRGRYYKPKTSVFGNIGPVQSEIVKDLLYDNGALSGYITGYAVWNQMGLTSQIPNIITIGTSRRRNPMKRGSYQLHFIAQPNRITSDSIPLLQTLDSLKMIKQIPDSDIETSFRILGKHIAGMEEKKLSMLVKLSKKYPPRVRALLGAILESNGNSDYSAELKKSLNPSTHYATGLNGMGNVYLNNWNIE